MRCRRFAALDWDTPVFRGLTPTAICCSRYRGISLLAANTHFQAVNRENQFYLRCRSDTIAKQRSPCGAGQFNRFYSPCLGCAA